MGNYGVPGETVPVLAVRREVSLLDHVDLQDPSATRFTGLMIDLWITFVNNVMCIFFNSRFT